MKTKSLLKVTKILLIISAVALVISIFVPLWSIYLEAPQYPEGLAMFLHANKISGEYEIINGLNHYIGMKLIKEEDFVEFKVLPYILAALAAICLAVAIINKRIWLYVITILYMIFGVGFMYDFWRWEYDYGHDLDPTAAIIVPGMTYQPPLIGSKVLLNFTAHSWPNIGGALMIAVAVFLIIASYLEWRKAKSMVKSL